MLLGVAEKMSGKIVISFYFNLGVTQMLVNFLREYPKFVFFSSLFKVAKNTFSRYFFLFSDNKSLKTFKINKKVENNQKHISTSFPVPSAPKSWSKYTTRERERLMFECVRKKTSKSI